MIPGLGGAVAAILLMATIDAALNVYSSVKSSPETTEMFPERRNITGKYLVIADGLVIGLGILGFAVSYKSKERWFALVGALVVVVFMHTLYTHATRQGMKKQNQGY